MSSRGILLRLGTEEQKLFALRESFTSEGQSCMLLLSSTNLLQIHCAKPLRQPCTTRNKSFAIELPSESSFITPLSIPAHLKSLHQAIHIIIVHTLVSKLFAMHITANLILSLAHATQMEYAS